MVRRMRLSWSVYVLFIYDLNIDFFADKNCYVKVNFAPYYVAPPGAANVQAVADHIEHIANITGKQQSVSPHLDTQNVLLNPPPLFSSVGIGSDFDGIANTPRGLEDVSKYPALVSLSSFQFLQIHPSYIVHNYSRSLNFINEAGIDSSFLALLVPIYCASLKVQKWPPENFRLLAPLLYLIYTTNDRTFQLNFPMMSCKIESFEEYNYDLLFSKTVFGTWSPLLLVGTV